MRLTGLFGAALLLLTFSSAANAYDHRYERERDHWRHEHWRHEHSRNDHWRPERPVVVRERPMVVRERPMIVERERPVFVQPAPMYAAPMQMPMQMPMPYNQGPSGLNLNFNIPLN